jgi:hypothetical protein
LHFLSPAHRGKLASARPNIYMSAAVVCRPICPVNSPEYAPHLQRILPPRGLYLSGRETQQLVLSLMAVRAELLYKSKSLMPVAPIEAAIIVTKAHMFPASNSML